MQPRRLTRGHLLATVFRLYSLERWTTLARRILIVADVCHLLVPVRPVVVVLTDVSRWVLLAHPIDLVMDLALGRPALAVVADPQTSMTSLMRMVLTMTSARRHFFGLAPAPQLATKMMAPVIRYL